MIQRIQSVFLLIVGISMVLTFFFPIWQKENGKTAEKTELTYYSLEYKVENKSQKSSTTIYLAILAGLAAGLAFYGISRYDNRMVQLTVGSVNNLVMCAVLGLSTYMIFEGEKTFDITIKGSYLVGFYLPIAALICNILANRAIRKDEKLVKSADRMR